jgi:hypothetical protein
MSFKLINRLVWLFAVVAAATAVVITGLLALTVGVDRERVAGITVGGLAATILVVGISLLAHPRRTRRKRQDVEPVLSPWYSGLPGVPVHNSLPVQPPPSPGIAQPTLAVSRPPGSADVTMLPHRSQSGAETTPASGIPLDSLADTRPMRRVQIQELPPDTLEDTRPRQAVRPTTALKPAARGPYDDLFPPPQPDDEDYLECGHDPTTLLPPDEAHEEPPTTPILPVPTNEPVVIDRLPDAPNDQAGDQTAKSGDEASISPDSLPA